MLFVGWFATLIVVRCVLRVACCLWFVDRRLLFVLCCVLVAVCCLLLGGVSLEMHGALTVFGVCCVRFLCGLRCLL